MAVFLPIAALLSTVALSSRNDALSQQQITQHNLQLSESERLAADANLLYQQPDGDKELAALLSLQAMKTVYTPEADIALGQASHIDFGVRMFNGHSQGFGITSESFSQDGRLVVLGNDDLTAQLFDVQSGQMVHEFDGNANCVALSPDGRYLATGGSSYYFPTGDSLVHIWDVQSGKEIRTLSGHTQGITGVAFSPDGRYLLTGSDDSTARLWDFQTGQTLHVFSDSAGPVQGSDRQRRWYSPALGYAGSGRSTCIFWAQRRFARRQRFSRWPLYFKRWHG